MNLVKVDWIDSETHMGWESAAEFMDKLNTVTTVGYLVYENEEQITIASSYDPEAEHYNSVIRIPKVCVTNREEIK